MNLTTWLSKNNEAQKRVFTPADIFNPAFWVRPEDLPVSGEIATWIDSSGNSRNVTQATSANRPIVLDNALNGYRAATFDGSNDFLRTTNFVPITTGNYSYFIVYSHPATASARCLFLNGADVNGFSYFLFSGLQRSPTHSSVANMNDGNANTNTFEIASVVRTSAPLATLEVNGTNQSITSSTSALSNPTFGLTIGSRQGDSFAQASICEIIIYDKALNTTERASVTNYLKSKYNL